VTIDNRTDRSKTKWMVIEGDFDFKKQQIVFVGAETPYTDKQGQERMGNKIGLAVNNQEFAGGKISAKIEFTKIQENNSCEILFYFDPEKRWFVSAGLGGAPGQGFFIRHWDGQWTVHASGGSKSSLLAKQNYDLAITYHGSQVTLAINEVDVLSVNLPFSPPPSQTGIQCIDCDNIKISDFSVKTTPGKAFVVMQFSSPYNEIYEDVIKTVCLEFGVEARRADETYSPGLILADIVEKITESEFVIAEITPANPNVYYEVGYAHAINKPIILLVDSDIEKLPFDISGFRALFYENTIAGKSKFEEKLRKHISVIFQNTLGNTRL
jgi:hypothetical protein